MHTFRINKYFWFMTACAILVALPGCESDDLFTDDDDSTADVETTSMYLYVESGIFYTNDIPTASNSLSRPAITSIASVSEITNGAATDLIIYYEDPDGLDTLTQFLLEVQGDNGYCSVPVVYDDNNFDSVRITLLQDLPYTSLVIRAAAGDHLNLISDPITTSFDIVSTVSNDIRITLTFDQSVDLDLHVIEPDGEEIYYANRTSDAGGILETDSNSGCHIDGRNTEIISWPIGSAPDGTYTIRVDYYIACVDDPVNYTVTVERNGIFEQFTGQFTSGDADQGGPTSGRFITSFTY